MKTIFCAFAIFVAASLSPLDAAPLEVGAKVPDAQAYDLRGDPVRIRPMFGRQYTLVYFYPKADTPGCTVQAKALRDSLKKLESYGITVIGVSNDTPEDQAAFARKYGLNFPLLADPNNNVIGAFGVPVVNAHAARQSFIVHNGKVVWRDLNVDPSHQAADAARAVASLTRGA